MRGRGLAVFALALLVGSCGLETVPSLSVPPANYADGTLVTDSRLTFIHDAARYAGSSFLAYVVYYKIYPVGDTASFARLLEDRGKLASSPTVNQLASLGYQQFSVSTSDSGSPATRSMEISSVADGKTVTLDFSGFLETGSKSQPLLILDNKPASAPYVYRSLSLGETVEFGALRSESRIRADMASNITASQLAERAYELNVFVAAYGLTTALTEIYSSPVPWGVIRTIQPY